MHTNLSAHDPVWQYLPQNWGQGAFLGNGWMGAMVYSGGNDQHRLKNNVLRWELGRVGVTAQCDRSGYLEPRVLIGDFMLQPRGTIGWEAATMRLDLAHAELRGSIPTNKGNIQFRTFVHATQQIIVVEAEGFDGEYAPDIAFYPQHGVSPWIHYREGEALDRIPQPPMPEGGLNGPISYNRQRFIGGAECVVAWQTIKVDNGIRLFITIEHGKDGVNVCERAFAHLHNAIDCEWDAFLVQHREWWQKHYSRSALAIPDTRLEGFYWLQRYKMGSATRSDAPVLDILGPWMTLTPWPGVWWNLNAQFIYSPFYAANHTDLAESLSNTLRKHLNQLIANAPEPYRHDSAALGRASTYDCDAPTGPGCEMGNLIWICHNLWRHYRTTMNETLVREVLFPILRRAVNLYLHVLEADQNGILHLPPTISPEYSGHQNLTTRDCHFDLALLRWGCRTLLSLANDILELDDPLVARWEDTLEHLVPFPIDETGFRIGADLRLDHGHRHFSHLMAGYPLWVINRNDSQQNDLIRKSLQHWLGREGALAGFSFGYAAATYAHIRDGDAALDCLNVLLDNYLLPNSMYAEKGPVLETPLQAADAIHDLLLQSNCGCLDIFPALPTEWENAYFENLAAEGGFLVSAVYENKSTRAIRIKSLAGQPCRIRSDLPTPCAIDAESKPLPLTPREESIWQLNLEKGQTALIRSQGDNQPFASPIIASNPKRYHYYGTPKPWLSKIQ
jgi:alpha-L-fucosidase 2